MRPIHLIGLLLWRGGLLLAGVWMAVESMRLLVRLVDVPPEIELGTALLLGGVVLVLVSLVLERLHDVRSEGELAE